MRFKGGYRYVTTSPAEQALGPWAEGLSFNLQEFVILQNQVLRISAHYAWDGASFFLFKWFGTPGPFKVPSLFHDGLYQGLREGKLAHAYRDEVDLLFYDMLVARGVWRWVAAVAYYAVRIFGNYAMRHGAREREVA